MPSTFRHSTTLVSALLLGATGALADGWPQWRGERQDGSALSEALGSAEALDLEVAWRHPLGSGYSSISIVDDLGVTMAAIGESDWLIAFDAASGRERWRFELGPRFLGRSGSDDGPMSTPAIADAHVYGLSAEGRFVALEADTGSLVWERDLIGHLGSEPDLYGFSTAPLVHGGRVFLLAGGSDGRMLVAFDLESGEVAWKTGSDEVLHHVPAIVTLDGVEQVVAPARRSVSGYAIGDGRLLWRHEFEEEAVSGGVLPIDSRRVLVTRWESTHLLEVETSGEARAVREVWETTDLSSTYAIPIQRGRHLYGFNRRFLTCVDLDTGETVWKSRPPGGQALIGIGDHLLVVADDGELVAVEASPEGYRETGRLGLFGRRRVMTPPSFAADRIFVRDLTEMVALDARPAALRASEVPASGIGAPAARTGGGELAALLARATSAEASERAVALEAMGRYASMPVRDGGEVHFLFRGEVPDLAIVGDMTGGHQELPMRRLGDSDWYHRSFPEPERGRWEYRFKVFDEDRLDPLNPSRIETPEGERSVVGFGDDAPVQPPSCQGCPAGTLVSHTIESTVPDRSYDLTVYTPSGYEESGERRYPVVVWAQGALARHHGDVVRWLDGLIGTGEIEPVVAVLLELPDAAWWGQSRSRLAEVMTQDVMPFLEGRYRLSKTPGDRSVAMQGWASMNMLLWSLGADIGNVALQSPFLDAYYLDRALAERVAGSGLERVWIDWGEFDQRNPDWALDVEVQAPALAEMLRDTGAEVVGAETPGGANWTRWSGLTGKILRFLHPLD